MKNFEEPKLEVVLFTTEDIMAISADGEFGGGGADD